VFEKKKVYLFGTQSSGSGSESGIQTQKCTKSKGANESGNNSGSNDDEAGMGLNARDDSDNGSGTQVWVLILFFTSLKLITGCYHVVQGMNVVTLRIQETFWRNCL
jgi:hypothetical protein